MLFVLSGPWGVGKSEVIKYLSDNYGFQTLIPWSTKVSDADRGTKYNLLLKEKSKYTNEELRVLSTSFDCPFIHDHPGSPISKGLTGFWCQPFTKSENYQVLGYKLEEIQAVSNQNAVVIEADTMVAQQLKYAAEEGAIGRVITIFLNYKNEHCFAEKLKHYQGYSEKVRSVKRAHRIKEIDFYEKNRTLFDEYIIEDHSDDVCRKIVEIALRYKVPETPNMLHKRAGILSEHDVRLSIKNSDISISIESQYQERVNRVLGNDIYKNGHLSYKAVTSPAIDLCLSPKCRVLKPIKGKHVDLLLGNHISLDKLLTRNKLTSKMDLNNEEILSRITDIVRESRTEAHRELFEEKEISFEDGLTLRPNEIVLCSTLENIEIGSNVFSFITSKYSFSQIGLSITLSQNILQPCHKGKVMLQLVNHLPHAIVIYPYMQIAQCVFFRSVSNSTNCAQPHADFEGPRYDETDSFRRLAEEILREKDFFESHRRVLNQEDEEEKKTARKEKRDFWQMIISVSAIVIALATAIIMIVDIVTR